MKVLARVIGGVAIAILFAAVQAGAAGTNILNLGGSPYTENFDSIGTGSTQPPLGWNAGSLTGASVTNGIIASVATLNNNTGGSTTSGNFNYGSSGGADRAIGALSAASVTRATEVRFLNNTGFTITNLTISYDGEQWRDGGSTANADQLGLTFSQDTVGGLTNFTAIGASFNFTAPKNTATAGALDGNLAANRVAGIGGAFTVSIAAGEVFVLRWIDPDIANNDDGMAIDNFSLGYDVAIPEPSTVMLVGIGLLGTFIVRRRRS
jgi:hypothetical protein